MGAILKTPARARKDQYSCPMSVSISNCMIIVIALLRTVLYIVIVSYFITNARYTFHLFTSMESNEYCFSQRILISVALIFQLHHTHPHLQS